MKRVLLIAIALICTFGIQSVSLASNPDSAYIFAYSTMENGGRNGLHFAWSVDREHWHAIGAEHSFLKSDYGTWGGQKRMYDPFLMKDSEGEWHCVWSLNNSHSTFAYATSKDLIHWQPQVYPELDFEQNCLMPVIIENSGTDMFTVIWKSDSNGEEYYDASSSDLIYYGSINMVAKEDYPNNRDEVFLREATQTGTIHKVAWEKIEKLINHEKLTAYNQELYHETTDQDSQRFADLKELKGEIRVDMQDYKAISDELVGVFFEDINYGADGGLYAELVQNRGFEYDPADTRGRNSDWNSMYSWRVQGEHATFTIDSVHPVHANNKHFAVLTTKQVGDGLMNEGFNGIPLKEGEKYNFSMFGRTPNGEKVKVIVKLVDEEGATVGGTNVIVRSGEWDKVEGVIRADKDIADARLVLVPQSVDTIEIDMISLFPQNTFKGHKNGLRADLAQLIADMKPRFLRFPGGCVAHGDGLDNIYRWKNTIGPLESRKPQRNIWNYHQSMGLGFFEYFQFCEDLDSEPIPIVAAGVPCQNSSCGGAGQQGGIPMNQMDSYIQDVLDLIEWANGDKNTEWGRKRAEAGHPEPFNLKYLGVGNEDLISHVFEERFKLIYEAIKEQHPEIVVIGTVGPFWEGSDYRRGWEFARELNLPMVDEHYYQPPGWFIHNQDYYDKYDRSGPDVYLGEYAAHLPGRPRNVETALSEALYLTALERNGDVVRMASYAPLLAREGNTQWNPDLIYFNNIEVKPTVGYFIQKLYGQNAGDVYYHNTIQISDGRESVEKRIAVSVVRDSETNDMIVKMINLLPVKADVQLKMDGAEPFSSKAVRTVLSGHPDDTDACPITDEISVSEVFDVALPAYSFTVIRINEWQAEK
ncbi:alpha-L-arabinofuranosidase C-terminal domain-containing protein [Marinilabilia sp.]|uniref:alpha-L-arabinofuranosidase C-terminal domain-containing protein n=1 Tax=Marinilabilia sp. TaxID=2021252 RepID=UPI0025B9BA48|nr:alpha-L-arabinofuranosidase C-terminal domain-containing protein [Marinilabilia sp.]